MFILMKQAVLTLSVLAFSALPAMAQLDSPTPQYSGPAAAIENRGMENRGQSNYPASPVPMNDRASDWISKDRSLRAQEEMTLRRDEIIRANERYILKMNE